MKYTRKIFIGFLLAIFCSSLFFAPVVSAQILPKSEEGFECKDKETKKLKEDVNAAFQGIEAFREAIKDGKNLDNLLGCAVKTGKIRLFMMPFFITYLVEFLLQIAGLIAVLFIVYGGFKYVTGGLIEDKESGKKAVIHAIIGLVVALSAWIVVNFIQMALTS